MTQEKNTTDNLTMRTHEWILEKIKLYSVETQHIISLTFIDVSLIVMFFGDLFIFLADRNEAFMIASIILNVMNYLLFNFPYPLEKDDLNFIDSHNCFIKCLSLYFTFILKFRDILTFSFLMLKQFDSPVFQSFILILRFAGRFNSFDYLGIWACEVLANNLSSDDKINNLDEQQ